MSQLHGYKRCWQKPMMTAEQNDKNLINSGAPKQQTWKQAAQVEVTECVRVVGGAEDVTCTLVASGRNCPCRLIMVIEAGAAAIAHCTHHLALLCQGLEERLEPCCLRSVMSIKSLASVWYAWCLEVQAFQPLQQQCLQSNASVSPEGNCCWTWPTQQPIKEINITQMFLALNLAELPTPA